MISGNKENYHSRISILCCHEIGSQFQEAKIMTKVSKVVTRYSTCFKRKVVKEIEEEGLSYKAASRRFGIKGDRTVSNWVREYGKNHLKGYAKGLKY